MSQIVDTGKEPKRRRVKSSDREPLNWVSKLSCFENDLFPVATGLIIRENYSKGILHLPYMLFSPLALT